MADHSQNPNDVDPHIVAHAQSFWTGFMKVSNLSILGVIIILILLALFVA